jgi:hypothetical protein
VLLRAVAALLGAALVVAGLALVNVPAALVVAGLGLVGFGLFSDGGDKA